MRRRSLVIWSGGQTGVDRGALDAALACGLEIDGWCPAGRRAEDGIVPLLYPLRETATADYPLRTRRNVLDSDGTLLITFGPPSGGTSQTLEFCRHFHRPHLVIDAEVAAYSEAVQSAVLFVQGHGIRHLNVAGPRASHEPRGYGYARRVVTDLAGRLG